MKALGTKDPIYIDAKTTLSLTPDADLSSVIVRAYLVRDGNRVQWGSDRFGFSSGTEITINDTPVDLTLDGSTVDQGRYVIQWVYEDSDGDENTIAERDLHLSAPTHE